VGIRSDTPTLQTIRNHQPFPNFKHQTSEEQRQLARRELNKFGRKWKRMWPTEKTRHNQTIPSPNPPNHLDFMDSYGGFPRRSSSCIFLDQDYSGIRIVQGFDSSRVRSQPSRWKNHPIAEQEQVSHTDLACLWRYEAKRKSSPSVKKKDGPGTTINQHIWKGAHRWQNWTAITWRQLEGGYLARPDSSYLAELSVIQCVLSKWWIHHTPCRMV